jgi:hypothetical protein
MNVSKALSDGGWKDVSTKNKIKDNGLLKLLGDHKRLSDDAPDEVLASLDQISKLATQLKKAKDVAASPAASKYVGEIIAGAESDRRLAEKTKADAEKKAKAASEAEAKKREQDRKGGDEEEDKDEAGTELLTTKMIPLLRQVKKGDTMHALVATAGQQVVVMLSRKPISPTRRKLLADHLGVSGGVKYFHGHCLQEEGATTFALQTQVAGLAKKLKLALLEQTGLRVNVKCRGEAGDVDADIDAPDAQVAQGSAAPGAPAGQAPGAPDGQPGQGPEATAASSAAPEASAGMVRPFEISAAVGRGGKNLEDDVKAVQMALNRRADARLDVDGRCTPKTIEAIVAFQSASGQSQPNGLVEPGRGTARALAASGKIGKAPPPPNPRALPEDLGPPSLGRAHLVWEGARNIVGHNIEELKRAIRQEYKDEHPDVFAGVDEGANRLDGVLDKFDTRLTNSLQAANQAKDPASRKTELANAKKILGEYIAFVKSEPLIDHIDKNPFGVDAKLRKTLTDSLTHVIKSMA